MPGHKLELTGTYLDGKPLDWEAYRGKVVLVDFWATWCGPCRAEVPNVLENYRKYHDKGFDVLGISLDEKRSDVEQYMRDSGVPWRTTFYAPTDPQHKQPPMALKYGVTAIPRCILVDQQGNVVNLNARGKVLGRRTAKAPRRPAGRGKFRAAIQRRRKDSRGQLERFSTSCSGVAGDEARRAPSLSSAGVLASVRRPRTRGSVIRKAALAVASASTQRPSPHLVRPYARRLYKRFASRAGPARIS